MKRLYLSLLSCLCALCAWSQQDNLYRYDRIPDAFQQVFNDVAAECVTCLVNTANGQYWGSRVTACSMATAYSSTTMVPSGWGSTATGSASSAF